MNLSDPTHATGKPVASSAAKLQIGIVLASFAAAVTLMATAKPAAPARGTAPTTPGAVAKPFNMLAFVDERIGTQEDKKDVRCWSSFNKLQMFITQCEISEEAKSVRIDEHMRLIQSIWQEAQQRLPGSGDIPASAVEAVLDRRFPHVSRNDTAQFGLKSGSGVLQRLSGDDLKDYGDTIEPWRLLQTWAARRVDARGVLVITPTFEEKSLHVLYRFFRAYDLVVLQQAREAAHKKKLTLIDEKSMAEAFQSEGSR